MARILLVDDNAELLHMQDLVLTDAGHEVVTASNGSEALRIAGLSTFGLVITDVLMPEMDGLEIIMVLRKRAPGLKIIAVTGGGKMNASNYLDFAKSLGAARTLTKPVTGRQLLQTVNSVLGVGL